jgi:hypothetical protein
MCEKIMCVLLFHLGWGLSHLQSILHLWNLEKNVNRRHFSYFSGRTNPQRRLRYSLTPAPLCGSVCACIACSTHARFPPPCLHKPLFNLVILFFYCKSKTCFTAVYLRTSRIIPQTHILSHSHICIYCQPAALVRRVPRCGRAPRAAGRRGYPRRRAAAGRRGGAPPPRGRGGPGSRRGRGREGGPALARQEAAGHRSSMPREVSTSLSASSNSKPRRLQIAQFYQSKKKKEKRKKKLFSMDLSEIVIEKKRAQVRDSAPTTS